MEAGSLFASYKIVKKLGYRSSGELYLAMEVAGSSYVTLLVLDENDPLYSAREPNFKGERAAAGTFNHSSVCKIFDSGKHGTKHFLAIEYVRGTTMEELLDKRVPLSPEQRSKMAQQVALAVLAGHSAGVSHGGLLPSTVYYEKSAEVKVMGFGCQTTPFNPPFGFIAPERLKGDEPTPQADLYSVAAVVSSLCLQGHIPSTDEVVSSQTLEERVRNGSTFAQFDGELREILMILFSENPSKRDQGAVSLVQCLDRKDVFKPRPFKYKLFIEDGHEKEAEDSEENLDQASKVSSRFVPSEDEELLEEADSCYWRAQSATYEGDFVKAIKEYRKIMSFPLAIVSPLAEKVENEACSIFWQSGLKSDLSGSFPGPSPSNALDLKSYISLLQSFLPLSRSLRREALITVTERRLLETILLSVNDKSQRSHLFREALMRCRNSTWTKKQYCSFLEFDGRKQEALTQRMKLALTLASEGLITEALDEYKAALKLNSTVKAPPEIAKIKNKAEKLKIIAEGVVEVLDNSGSSAIHVAEHFLARMPSSVKILEKLACLKSEQGMLEEAARLRGKATAICYNRSNRSEALSNATEVLKIKQNDPDALSYAIDLLQREGERPEGKNLRATAEKVLSILEVN